MLCSHLGANDFKEIISFHLVKICYYRFKKARRVKLQGLLRLTEAMLGPCCLSAQPLGNKQDK